MTVLGGEGGVRNRSRKRIYNDLMDEEKEKDKDGATGTRIVNVDTTATTTSSDREVSGVTTTALFTVATTTEKGVMEDAMGGLVCWCIRTNTNYSI